MNPPPPADFDTELRFLVQRINRSHAEELRRERARHVHLENRVRELEAENERLKVVIRREAIKLR